MEIITERFLLRPLIPEDARARYSAWFDDAAARKNISAAAAPHGVEDLRRYIIERQGRDDVLFLGIFERVGGVHIGNVKYEPVDSSKGYAVMGILIGEPTWRGRGVAEEVLKASARWLQEHRGVREIVLGVRADNGAAIRAYEKVGFRVKETDHIRIDPDGLSMVWRLKFRPDRMSRNAGEA